MDVVGSELDKWNHRAGDELGTHLVWFERRHLVRGLRKIDGAKEEP